MKVEFLVLNDSTYEEYCFLECGALYFGRHVPMFLRNLMPPSSGSNHHIPSNSKIELYYQIEPHTNASHP
jgi:hypothetical protein